MNSIVTKEGYCAVCGRQSSTRHHLVFGRGKRNLAESDGLWITLCDEHHNMAQHTVEQVHGNPIAESFSKMIGQLAFEKKQVSDGVPEEIARSNFRQRYGISYL